MPGDNLPLVSSPLHKSNRSKDAPFRILVVCTGNRARSQMAHGWLSQLGGEGVSVESAGTEPKGVHPLAIQAMAEVGIDISDHTFNHVDRYAGEQFDLVLTVCDSAKEKCPLFPGAKRLVHRSFEDPDQPNLDGADLRAKFAHVRDEIGDFARALLFLEIRA